MSEFNNRIEQGLHRLFVEARQTEKSVAAASQLGAALCIGSGGAPYDECRNPFASSAPEFIDFKMGWQLAAMNRDVLKRMGAIACAR